MEREVMSSSEVSTADRFFSDLQSQVGIWSQYNFGNQLPHRPAMGLIEELMELSASLQNLEHEGVLDAIGDVTIYMADYCYRRGWDLAELWRKNDEPGLLDDGNVADAPSLLCRMLSHAHLKGEQNIRGGGDEQSRRMKKACSGTLWYLSKVCAFLNEDLITVVGGIWDEVKKRDWKKNPNTAHLQSPPYE
jgi:hypothetical protein